MVRTVIVTRGEITFITLLVFRPLGRLARALVHRTDSVAQQDRIMTL